MLVTSAALVAHHAFGIWHGDFRLKRKWGEVRIFLAMSLHCEYIPTEHFTTHIGVTKSHRSHLAS